jgi:hypothetical protein
MPNFEIPADMPAEKSVEQARIAFNTFMTAAQQAAATFEGQAKAAHAGAKDIGDKAMGYAERNVANTFAFASRLVHAKDSQDFIRLQMPADRIHPDADEGTRRAGQRPLRSMRPGP